ncbi:hypothetical protein F503_00245 [Ophiostoma piceae UAMH 11346]|uniref:Uncharacterized protein n=1 Tax=Ophiostoma piceae (strain UAMH 11346) TaxID=1262450 RepID=S3CLY3_OPHP1|nr:hypothetical protein F503_00245 [Ophiostoma piceae UAMH 11346]
MSHQHPQQSNESSTTPNLQHTPGTGQQPPVHTEPASAGVQYIVPMHEQGSYIGTLQIDGEGNNAHVNGEADEDDALQDGAGVAFPAAHWRQGEELPYPNQLDRARATSSNQRTGASSSGRAESLFQSSAASDGGRGHVGVNGTANGRRD